MTNSPGYYSGYGGDYGDPGGAYGAYAHGAPHGRSAGNANRVRVLWLAVAVLGLVAFAVSFGSPVLLGWAVWFGVLAAVLAAVGLLAQQGNRGWLVVALAVTGFLVALSTWIYAEDDAGWAVIVVVVLDALQAIVAIAALLLEGGGADAGDGDGESDYVAYAKYMQAYQAYAMQYQQGPPPRVSPAGQATAYAQGAAAGQARDTASARGQAADAAQESYEALQQRYVQPDAYPAAPQRSSAGMPSAGPDPGLPSYGRGAASPQSYAEQPGGAEEASPN